MDARFSRQVMVPGIGPEGQARIQNSSFCALTSKHDALRSQCCRLYAQRAGLQEAMAAPEQEPTAHPIISTINEFFNDPACRSVALGATDALLALNDALTPKLASSPAIASESKK